MTYRSRRREPLYISRILVVEPGDAEKPLTCACKNVFPCPIPQFLRCSTDIRCPKCRQQFHVQWVETARVRPGTEPPDDDSYFSFVAINPDGSSETVEWRDKKWLKYGKEIQVHQWFELNRQLHRAP